MPLTPTSYRDRIYMIEDIILKLVEYGELNQIALISFSHQEEVEGEQNRQQDLPLIT